MHRLCSLLLALCGGCGAMFASVSSSGMDRAMVRSEEAEAVLYCGGRPCDAAPVQRRYSGRLSKFGYVAGTAVDAGVLGLGFSRGRRDEILGMVIVTLYVAIEDILVPLENRGFDGTAEPWTLPQPVSTDFRGQRTELSAIDLVQDGKPRPAFSVGALQQLQRDAKVSSNGGICLRTPGTAAPGEDMVVAIFDAMNDAAGLRTEDVRSLSDVLRATAAVVAPEARLVETWEMPAGAACAHECMTRIGATFAIRGSVWNDGGERHYSARASKISSGEVVAEAIASGKTMGELAAAVRKMAGLLFRCAE